MSSKILENSASQLPVRALRRLEARTARDGTALTKLLRNIELEEV
jgi:hypothetical protein